MRAFIISPQVPGEFTRAVTELAAGNSHQVIRTEDEAHVWTACADLPDSVLICTWEERFSSLSSLAKLQKSGISAVVICRPHEVHDALARGVTAASEQMSLEAFKLLLLQESESVPPSQTGEGCTQNGKGDEASDFLGRFSNRVGLSAREHEGRAEDPSNERRVEAHAMSDEGADSSLSTTSPAEGDAVPPGPASGRWWAGLQAWRHGTKQGRGSEIGKVPQGTARSLCVWGPLGGVGKTTAAVNIACAHAQAGRTVALLDADTWAASCAAVLGVLDEAATLVQAVRRQERKDLTAEEILSIGTRIPCGQGSVVLLSGLTSSARWRELSAAELKQLVRTLTSSGIACVIDVASPLAGEETSEPFFGEGRDTVSSAMATCADRVLAVTRADVVALSRLLKDISSLRETREGAEGVSVLFNGVSRDRLGFDPVGQLKASWRRYGPEVEGMYFLPFDHAVARALNEGRHLYEGKRKPSLVRVFDGMGELLE